MGHSLLEQGPESCVLTRFSSAESITLANGLSCNLAVLDTANVEPQGADW